MYKLGALALLARLAVAKQCVDLNIPIYISARNGVFNISEPQSNIDATNFILAGNQQGVNGTIGVLEGYTTVTGSYNIAATYCEPDSGPSDILQILTHGIGFDRSYWDLSYNNYNYSYSNVAVDQYGYSTFSWDRLGIAGSSHGDPIQEIQALLEVSALETLTIGLRAGTLPGITTAYGRTAHVGHSFGSQHTYTLAAMYPNITDAIVMTGFSQNGSFIPYFGYGSNFGIANQITDRFSDYPNGYLANQNMPALQTDFLSPDQFDPEILPFLFANSQPVTYGELLTIGGETLNINNFAGPTLIITGERDIPYCGGNCLAAPTGYDNIPSTSDMFLPVANPFDVVIVPAAGHGLNAHYSAPYTYSQINDFLVQNGLAPANGTYTSPTTSAPVSYSTPTGTPLPYYPPTMSSYVA